MFENYVGATTRKTPTWVPVVLIAAVLAHGGVGAALIVKQFWTITKLPAPESGIELSLGAPPPPPPPKGSGKKKPDSLKNKIKKTRIKETVQPVAEQEDDPNVVVVDEGDGEDFGVEGGVEGGVAGGVVGGQLGGQLGGVLGGTGAPPPPPPEPEKPVILPQTALKANRISGEKDIKPPESVRTLMVKQGQNKLLTTAKMCLTKGGAVKSVTILKSSGYQEYDRTIVTKMRLWKYRPFMVNGKAVPVCASVTFIYRFQQ